MKNNRQIYLDRLDPLIKKVHEICSENGINFFATVQFDETNLNVASWNCVGGTLNKTMEALFDFLSIHGVKHGPMVKDSEKKKFLSMIDPEEIKKCH